MTSETRFSTGFTSVWREVTPLSDGYWSVENMLTQRMMLPMQNKAPKELRGLVNELAFIAFCELVQNRRKTNRDEILAAVVQSIPTSVAYINRVSAAEPITAQDVSDVCVREALQIVLRLLSFFPTGSELKVRPKFAGCGLITACEGDLVSSRCLYEIKAGDRPFRISDLRQLLTYATLAYASNCLNFERIGLFNPRTGKAWGRSLDEVCLAVSGQLANDVFPKIVDHLTPVTASR